MKKSYQVEIYNQKFNVKSDTDEKHVQKVADLVNKTIFEIKKNTNSVSSLNVALLTALNIADEYYKLKTKQLEKTRVVKKEIKETIHLIDECLDFVSSIS
ncbi:MAG: cell division protein ZapA [Deltaproteobacteria bacterium]|nr:cell division protein ZapA [Deltaproteobacteria bacterium]